jgi:hypothetical protein
MTVTNTVYIKGFELKVCRQAAKDMTGGCSPLGNTCQTQAALISDSTDSMPNTTRQPYTSPIHAAMGMPTTDATDQPKNTKVMARPRRSGAVNCPMQAAACGVKMAGDTMAITRTHRISLKPGITSVRAWVMPYQSITHVSSLRRSCLAKMVAKMGALKHISTELLADIPEGRVSNIFHWGEEKRKFSQIKITYFQIPLKISYI